MLDVLKRMEETQEGETICLKYAEVQQILKLIEDQEERIAILLEGELFCPMCGKKLNV